MALVKIIGGSVVNTAGVPLPSKTVTLKNDDTNTTLTTTTTNADGEWEFPPRDETVRYRAEAAVGGSSSQVVVRKPASAEFDHLYANLSFRTAAAAVVAFGGPLTVGGALTVTGASNLNGGVGVTGTSTLNGPVNVGGALTVTGASNLNGGVGVTGTSTLNGAVNVGTTLTVTGASNLNGGLGVTGASTLNGAVAVGSTLNVTGASTLNGGMVLTTNAVATQPLRINGMAGQTAAMLQIRNSANTVLFAVNANGQTDILGPANFGGAVGFYGTSPIGGPNTVTGSRGGNAALLSLITTLANMGLFINSTTA